MSSLVVEDRTDVKDAEMVDFEADPLTRMDKILLKMKVGQSTLYLLLYQARIFVAVFRYSSPAAHFQACVITTAVYTLWPNIVFSGKSLTRGL